MLGSLLCVSGQCIYVGTEKLHESPARQNTIKWNAQAETKDVQPNEFFKVMRRNNIFFYFFEYETRI